ncbi:MAG: VOC family protein [Candidatus Sulfotelmatobacter sp.]
MVQTLGYVALVVRDYDEAIAFFTEKLGFELVEDSVATDRLGEKKRWVLVAPPHSPSTKLLLARASTPEEESRVGNQTGGRVFLFLHSDDFWRDYRAMAARGVKFCEAPREETYGTVVVFEDLYGNKWDLLQLRNAGGRSGRRDRENSLQRRSC